MNGNLYLISKRFLSIFEFQMSVKALSSWKIATTSQPFYPMRIDCIGFEAEYAFYISTMHTVTTFIFRNFLDAIENDKSPQKCYLHATLEPQAIQEVTVAANESIILMKNGQLKFYQTPKKLVTVEYLSSVKAIGCTKDGIALIRSSSNGMNFFVEIHPDRFQATEMPGDIKTYDISFDSCNFQNSWHHSQFKIKELHFPLPAANKLLRRIFREEVPLNESSDDRYLFFSIDNNLFSLQMDPVEHFVIPIVTCGANIIDFWAAKNGNWIAMLLSSGTMMLICVSNDGYDIHQELVYFGSEITAFALTNDLFIYSNGALIEWMDIELNEQQAKFEFRRHPVSLPGIAAVAIVAEFSIAVAISENCQFYAIKLPSTEQRVAAVKTSSNDTKQWIPVDANVIDQLQKLKFNLIELTDAYDNLLDRQLIYRHMLDAIRLKRADDSNVKSSTTTRFVGSCLATKMPPALTACEESQAINIVSSLAYDRNSSFFVQISMVTVIYANEFNTSIWNLRCRWLNDMRENEYANVKLTTESLLQPLKFIVHLRQQYLPEFKMEVNTMVKIGQSCVYLSFPVHLQPPNYCELLQVMPASPTNPPPPHNTELVCTMKLPRGITLNVLFHGKLINQTSKTNTTENSSYEIRLLGRRLTIKHQTDDPQCIELRCADARLIYYSKIYVYDLVRQKLSRVNKIIQVTANALKAYNVSSNLGLLSSQFIGHFSNHSIRLFFLFQNLDNFVNVVFDSDSTQYNNRTHELVQCIGKIRLVPAIELIK